MKEISFTANGNTFGVKMILIGKVKDPYGWLGNMAPYPIEWGGRIWLTTEAAFQAMRFEDKEVQLSIWREKSPMGAKMVAKGNANKMVIQPRSAEDLENMKKILRIKVEAHKELKDELLATGDTIIIEDCSNRRNDSGLFWGAANINGEWEGRNELGKMWMDLRKELK